MNEVILSKDLKRIETEIQFYKERAGESIWEIGRRLIHVKENDLTHGEFTGWVEGQGIQYREANRMMKVAKELKPNMTTLSHLGTSALYLIATLPAEDREAEHVTADGEVKRPDEMTVRELQDLKRQLKEKERTIEEQQKIIDQQADAQPEVIEKVVEKEVLPPQYKGLKSDNEQLSQQLREEQRKLKELEERNQYIEKEYDSLIERREERIAEAKEYEQLKHNVAELKGKMTENQRRLNSFKNIGELITNANKLLDTISPFLYSFDFEELAGDEHVYEKMTKLIERTEKWCADARRHIGDNIIIEGEFVND